MKKLIIWLVTRYNKKAKPENQLRVAKVIDINNEWKAALEKVSSRIEKEKLEVTNISKLWMAQKQSKRKPEIIHRVDRSFVDWVIKEYNKGAIPAFAKLQLRPIEIKSEYIEHLVTEFNMQGYNSEYRIDLITKDNLKTAPEWLIKRYNDVYIDDPVEILFKPIIFSAKTTSIIDTTSYRTESAKIFLRNMIDEKKYDLRQELIRQLYKSSFIHEDVEIQEQKIIIKLQIKAFSYGKES